MKKAFAWFKKLPTFLQNATLIVGLVSTLGLLIPQIRQNLYLYVTIICSAVWLLTVSWLISLYYEKIQRRHKRQTKIIYPYRSRSIIGLTALFLVAVAIVLIPSGRQFLAIGVGVQPTPTRLSFRPASADQSLMIIAQFDDKSAGKTSGYDLTGRIFRLVTDKVGENNTEIPVENLSHIITSTEQALRVLKDYNAKLLIWGSYDAAGARVKIEVDSETVIQAVCTYSDFEYSQADPLSIELTFSQGIPSYAAYISLLSLGIIESEAEDNESAIEFYTEALDVANESEVKINPYDVLVYRSYAHYLLGDYDQAIADLQLAEPKDENVFYGLGQAYRANKQYDLAVESYTKSLEYKRDFCTIGNRGIAYENKNQFELAIKDYEQALAISPDNARIHCFLGIAYGRKGDFPAAIAALERGLNLDATQAYCQDALDKAKKGIAVPQD